MKQKYLMALGFTGAIILWMLTGVWASIPEAATEEPATRSNLMKVSTLDSNAQFVSREIVLQGELEPIRQVALNARTASTVVQLIQDKGTRVTTGQPLLQLDPEDRHALLESARTALARAELELSATQKLQQKGLQSDTRLKAAVADLAQAKSTLARAELELEYIEIKAPFAGVLETRRVDIGRRVDVGDELFTLVDDSTIKAVGYVPQQSITKVKVGQELMVMLLDGRKAMGRVSFVARLGDEETHSFRIEAEVPNPEGLLNAGTSAELVISTGTEQAHFLSPSSLALDDTGQVGVKVVDQQQQVVFFPIQIIRTQANGFWVTGLPDQAQVITLGQGFVTPGEKVIPVPAG